MSANLDPIYPLTINNGYGKVLTANTNLDGTGTVVTCFTAGANGSIVDSIQILHLGVNVATVLRFFIKDGANYTLFLEVPITANASLNQAAASTAYEYIFDGVNRKRLTLKANATIVVSTGTVLAAGMQVTCFGGDY